jgi:hypothetical protein
MGAVRRTISLALALALMTAGFGFLAYVLILAPGWKWWMVAGSGFAGILGAYWLYEDFIDATPMTGGSERASVAKDRQ